MPTISLLKPSDQPPGTRRLLADLKRALDDGRFNEAWWIVAYAKSGPLLRLRDQLTNWRAGGKTFRAILGIDQRGTSIEALQLALELFDEVWTTQEAGLTFHPKMYVFTGPDAAEAFVGSNNLTVGGTEKNFEAGLRLELELPADRPTLLELQAAWDELLPPRCPATERLDAAGLAALIANGTVISERDRSAGGVDRANVGRGHQGRRSNMAVAPESPLPRAARTPAVPARTRTRTRVAGAPPGPTPTAVAAATRGLAIQVRAHHNGEIFLSVVAARQNPAFFRWPFTGRTTPKRPGNPSYPQLLPDPVVSITVYGAPLTPILTLPRYELNTVYYERKSEIRVTASPLVGVVPEYSVMILEETTDPGLDYEITIFTPASSSHAAWVAACNQTMPGGGRTPRRFGWF